MILIFRKSAFCHMQTKKVQISPCIWPRDFKLFSTQLSMTFILLINVKIPTIVGILTLMNMINTCKPLACYNDLSLEMPLIMAILILMSILSFMLS